MADVVDQMARDNAAHALSAIEAHEKVCAERQTHILGNLQDLKNGVEGLYRRFWAAALAIISLLITIVGGLVGYIATHH